MTQDEFLHINETIAVFDGWEIKEGGFEMPDKSILKVQYYLKDGYKKYDHELTYHLSWDALMPVVKKIFSNESVNVNYTLRITQSLLDNDIKKAWNHSYLFIDWLNKSDNKEDHVC